MLSNPIRMLGENELYIFIMQEPWLYTTIRKVLVPYKEIQREKKLTLPM
jgi:hypothetical protein